MDPKSLSHDLVRPSSLHTFAARGLSLPGYSLPTRTSWYICGSQKGPAATSFDSSYVRWQGEGSLELPGIVELAGGKGAVELLGASVLEVGATTPGSVASVPLAGGTASEVVWVGGVTNGPGDPAAWVIDLGAVN